MPKKQLDLFDNETELEEIITQLHNIAHRVENNGNLYGVGYSIREIADKLSGHRLSDRHAKILDEVVKEHGELLRTSESWYEP
jgi:hypothetical protein